jgi:uncharacterized membrane protein YbhN (UPF0104 family)
MTAQRWWPWLKRIGATIFISLLIFLLVHEARSIAWPQVLAAVRGYPPATLLTAALTAAASLGLYSCFDLLGRRYTGHTLSAPKVMTVTFVSYVFNLNLGSLVGALALRYRLYTRLGLSYGTITRWLSLSMLTNWLGYVLVAGAVFSLQPAELPPGWHLSSLGLRGLGLALLAAGTAYLLLCARSRRRCFTVRGHALQLPTWRLASLQALMGMSNWLLMSAVIFSLLPGHLAFTSVVSVLLIAAIAGVITHIPAGLGVLEAVFVALLSHQLPKHEVLAALVLYRLIYYLAPLALAALIYALLEALLPKDAS